MSLKNPEAASDARDALLEQQTPSAVGDSEEAVELRGTARELFEARHEDTFELDVHDRTVEFYRPMDAAGVDLSGIDESTRQRVKRGAALLDQYESQQRQMMQAADDGKSLVELMDDSRGSVDLMAEILAAHAVDESLQRPAVWKAIYRNQDKLGDLFEDFTAEGELEQQKKKLDALESLTSDSSSTN